MRCAGCGVESEQAHCAECLKAAQPDRYTDPTFWTLLAFDIWMNRRQTPAIEQREFTDRQLMAVLQACNKMSTAATHYDMVVIAMRAYGVAVRPTEGGA